MGGDAETLRGDAGGDRGRQQRAATTVSPAGAPWLALDLNLVPKCEVWFEMLVVRRCCTFHLFGHLS